MIKKNTILFFDMDGTLIETNYANFLAYRKAIQTVTKLGNDLIYNPDKRFTRSTLNNVIPNLTESDYNKIIQKKEEYYTDFLHKIQLNTKTADILFKYSKTNRTVLVSNCRKERALTTLNYFGIADNFHNIFCREFGNYDKKINKFHNAVLKLGVPPSLIIAFENEDSEIEDAKKAGISVINPINL